MLPGALVQSDATWITEDEFPDLNPTLLDWYLQDNSLASSSFPVGENDVVSPKKFYGNVYSRNNRRFRNLGIFFQDKIFGFIFFFQL